MKIKFLLALHLPVLLSATVAAAGSPDLETLVRRALPNCPGETKLTQEPLQQSLAAGMTGKLFTVENETAGCAGRYVALLTPRGSFYLGSPWPLGNSSTTPAERIRAFALNRLGESFQPVVGSQKNQDELLPVELLYTTEFGKVPMRGWTDQSGTVFFPGIFFPASSDFARYRLEQLAAVLADAPTTGPTAAPVWLIEFSDFQCPSCKAATKYVKPLLDKYAGQMRYTRVDYPLISSHPWAFGAAVIGRAIHQQDRDAFWRFKDFIYENQENLNLFTLEEFARGFVADHDLSLQAFNTAIASTEIRRQILESISAAYALQVFGTPSFLVNGDVVVPGAQGKNLEAVIEKALKK